MATTDIYHVVGSLSPARKSSRFLGGDVDDYVQVNNAAVARVAAGDTTGTFTAWVNVADITGTYTIIGAGDNNAVEFLELNIEAGLITARCTDATVAQFVTQADAINIKPHQWHHIALVQDGNMPKLYVDGELIASTNDTATDVIAWFDQLAGVDTMRIGAANKAGDASVTNEFKGAISDVKYFSTALTALEIDQEYEGSITVQSTVLENHWDMDDDYIDAGLGADDGTVVGGIVLNNNYSEFTSRMGFMTGTPVVADKVQITVNGNQGHAVVIKAA